MSGEVSYFSRFFVKFVEISAAGLASAISAYLLAHLGGLLSSSPTPASAPAQTAVQVGPTADEAPGACAPSRPRLLRPLPSTSRALCRSRIPTLPSRSPRVRP
jgi:hypothetical protein